MTHTRSSRSANEPVGPLADRLAALAHLFAVPVCEEAVLEQAGVDVSGAHKPSEDALAADHYRILSHDLMPDAGVFLEEDGMLGGPLARDLHAWMSAHGFAPDDSTRSPGHIVNELGFLAHLLRHGSAEEAAAFWYRHAAGWMPLVVLHLQRSGSVWFEAIGRSLTEATSKIAALGAPIHEAASMVPPALPESGIDLDEQRVGIARIGAFLAVPAHSGLVLSRARLAQLGRTFRLPTGFGSRARIVEGLLRSGAQYEGWTAVCDVLIGECEVTASAWATSPSSDHWKAEWTERLAFTRSVLEQMRDAEEHLHSADS